MNQITITDVLGLVAVISAAIFSAEVAEVVSPYIVIIAASAFGASFSLARREKSTRAGALWFFVRVCGGAVMLTVFVSTILAGMHSSLSARVLLAPVAFSIGLIGSDWRDVPRVFGDIAGMVLDLLNKFRSNR